MAILVQLMVAYLREAEDALDHSDGMFDAGANAGLPPICRAQFGCGGPTMGEVARVWRAHAEDRGLARVRRVAPDPPFVAVQQPGQDVAVVNVGRRDFDGVNQLALAVDPEMALHAEVPLPALLRLMHPAIARARRILRGGRGGDDRRVDDGARADGDALGAQVVADSVEQGLAEPVLFQEMAELADRRLVGHRFAPQVDTYEGPYGRGVVQRLFHGGIRQVEPVLKAVH